jgi:hypothetical protein
MEPKDSLERSQQPITGPHSIVKKTVRSLNYIYLKSGTIIFAPDFPTELLGDTIIALYAFLISFSACYMSRPSHSS